MPEQAQNTAQPVSKKTASAYELIAHSSIELNRSGRGRAVKAELKQFLSGPISSLDTNHWDSVEALIKLYRAGYRGGVLESL